MSDTKIIEALKHLTLTEKDFSAIADYFLKCFLENDSFCQSGKIFMGNSDFFYFILNNALKRFSTHATHLILMELSPYHLVYGTGIASNGALIAFYFFKDIHTGMAILCSAGKQVDFFKLTAVYVPGELSHSATQH